jgi:hypothetical protein
MVEICHRLRAMRRWLPPIHPYRLPLYIQCQCPRIPHGVRYIVIFVNHIWHSTHFVFWAVDLMSWDNNSMCKHHHVALCDPGIHSMAICHTRTRDSSRCWLLVSYPRIDDATPGVADYDNSIGWKSSIAHPAVVLDMEFRRNELWLCNSYSSDLPLLYQRIQLNADVYRLCHARVCHPADCPHGQSFVIGLGEG